MNTVRLKTRAAAASRTGGTWLTPLLGHWVDAACARLRRRAALVRVTVVSLRGSAPRGPGASMLVDEEGTVGTIGGGRLEWQAARAAVELLRAGDCAAVRIDELILGRELGQCCGGRVELWLERLTRQDLPWLNDASRSAQQRSDAAIETRFADGHVTHRLRSHRKATGATLTRHPSGAATLLETLGSRRGALWIFGAGHVGQALVRLLGELALFDILWIDPRPELLPAPLPDCVTARACAAPGDLLAAARPATRYVVLTHDHALDYIVCRAILERGDAAFLGLIGSVSKAARFRSRLRQDGIDPAGLTCPIGVPIASKVPAAIAIAIAGQLLEPGPAAAAARVAGGRIAASESHACGAACGSCGAPHRAAP